MFVKWIQVFIIWGYFLLLQNCATQENSDDEPKGTGTLIHDGFSDKINCFWFLKYTASGEWVNVEALTVLAEDVSEYYPVTLRNTPYAYNLSLKVSAKNYTEEQYSISLRILTEDWKDCSESKTVILYRVAEQDGMAEYRTYKEDGQGVFIFLAQKEMPSWKWYHVLKTCGSKFRLEGVVNE